MNTVCMIDGCSRKRMALGLCRPHYERNRRHGSPESGRRPPGLAEEYYREVVLTYDGDECLIWPFNRSRMGYGRFSGSGGLVHRRLCEEVNGTPPTPDHEAAHSCGAGFGGCVTKRHLSWKTHAENMADTVLHGTSPKGEKNPIAKLMESDVHAIRALKGKMTQKDIASLFGVCRTLISRIHAGKVWGWLERPDDLEHSGNTGTATLHFGSSKRLNRHGYENLLSFPLRLRRAA